MSYLPSPGTVKGPAAPDEAGENLQLGL